MADCKIFNISSPQHIIYFENFRTRLIGETSDFYPNKYGVHQSSVLGLVIVFYILHLYFMTVDEDLIPAT